MSCMSRDSPSSIRMCRSRYRGTYAGLGSEPVIRHLKQLGVTAVELMPVHSFISDRHLVENGLSNYWGYNSIGYFAPHTGYSASGRCQ